MPSSSSGSAQPAQRSTQKAPVCPVERECGACQHVGVPYAQQLASKDTRVAELFCRSHRPSRLQPILGMDEPYCYRNKVVSPYAPGRKLQGSANARAGKGRDARGGRDGKRAQKPRREILCGMYAAGSHRIVPTAVSSRTKRPSASSAGSATSCRASVSSRTARIPARASCATPWCAWDIPAARSWSRWSRTAALSPHRARFAESWCAAALASRRSCRT